ncbi:putative metalloprotease KNAG_0D00490 [Huiozyma naganishii CBS 8797]|uniref:Mitochondrial inner membrane protease ATP23 n=1 Tax=Huiozyma naganishii (strain ATCC MYA-139 / BCRC 22969 / CBS 8797 / KCTC 17520 / NBRC 10181 / NCYC 3082 / Yp74L-3) TaxID=1071383 RepID=J7S6J5_HUIN7|nr:hypothetical protein KNAG_0D00490 [Kazachstania naganishii CBS 8797]CCK69801.1 hypothetical protein KNAG_0D00490 [Kazachstania naganishii CBS 8797]
MAGAGGFEWWRRSMQYRTGLGLTAEEKQRYEEDYKSVLGETGVVRSCYKNRDWLLKYSPTVVFMIQQIVKLQERQQQRDRPVGSTAVPGIRFDESRIVCDVCDELKSGGYHPEFGVLLCQNRLRDKWHLEDTLAHELVHWYDNLKWEVDWLNLRHHACSEIRASSLSGECRFWQEFSRRGFGFTVNRGHQDCVRRRAVISVTGNPKCDSQEQAERVVDEVWDSCFGDTRPFNEIYR